MKRNCMRFLTTFFCLMSVFPGNTFSAENRLNSSAILNVVAGRTLSIVTSTQKVRNFRLEKTGTVLDVGNTMAVTGKWSVYKNKLCLDISELFDGSCMTVVRHDASSSHLFLFTPAGEPIGEIRVIAN